MRKRHTNAVFLGDLRGRTAGKITQLERIAAGVSAEMTAAWSDLNAIDRVIRLFDPRIDPGALPVIHSCKKIPRGSKGGLTLALRGILDQAGSEGLSIREVGWALQLRHNLVFETPKEFTRYLKNTVERRLREMEHMTFVESMEIQTPAEDGTCRAVRRWRLKLVGSTIESLVADAKARGTEVVVVDAEALAVSRSDPD
jgi:hypothetical protein